jgi:hypothetical protein
MDPSVNPPLALGILRVQFNVIPQPKNKDVFEFKTIIVSAKLSSKVQCEKLNMSMNFVPPLE